MVAAAATVAAAAAAGCSVTRCGAEQAEHTGWGGAELSAEKPLPAKAADPGPGPGLALWTEAHCCSLSRSRCVGRRDAAVGLGSGTELIEPQSRPCSLPLPQGPSCRTLVPLPETPGENETDQDA